MGLDSVKGHATLSFLPPDHDEWSILNKYERVSKHILKDQLPVHMRIHSWCWSENFLWCWSQNFSWLCTLYIQCTSYIMSVYLMPHNVCFPFSAKRHCLFADHVDFTSSVAISRQSIPDVTCAKTRQLFLRITRDNSIPTRDRGNWGPKCNFLHIL